LKSRKSSSPDKSRQEGRARERDVERINRTEICERIYRKKKRIKGKEGLERMERKKQRIKRLKRKIYRKKERMATVASKTGFAHFLI